MKRSHAGSLVALLALSIVTGGATLWGYAPPPAADQLRLPPDVSPFPVFTPGSDLHVVRVPPEANYSTRLTLLSLQGLANRNGVELFLDFQNETPRAASMLRFISERYGVAYDEVAVNWSLSQYASIAKGLFVYDPLKPESVNIGTVYAGIRDWAIVGPDNAAFVSTISGLPIALDYAKSDWATLDVIEAYERALRELYPLTDARRLGILPPDRLMIRDYLIATKTFVFYYPQGPLASPWDLSATVRVLRATPRGIPIIGWIETPTVSEENAFVQILSAEGKYLVGVWDVPNLTVLSAYGRGQTFRQREQTPPPLQDKTYAVLAVPDGDNLDFVADTMMKHWVSPIRGSIPIAWSLNPLLVELAPPYMDYYYGTASSGDAFVAGPSAGGYVYPDYVGPGDLGPYLDRSARYLQAADMDVVWLLNAFPAYEVPYRAETLSRYVETLRPRGIVLDFDDQPTTRAAWMAEGGSHASPVVRSTHFWTSKENFIGKVMAAADSWDGGPHFLWITLFPFTHDLGEAKAAIDELASRVPGGLELVAPQAFFALLSTDFQRRAAQELETARADPFASLLFRDYLTSAQGHVDTASEEVRRGNGPQASHDSFLALQDLRAINKWEAVLAGALIAGGLAISTLALTKPRPNLGRRAKSSILPLLALSAVGALFFLALRSALDDNFWTYYSVGVGILVAGLAVPLGDLLERTFSARALSVSTLIFLVSTAITFQISAAFPLAMLGALLILISFLRRWTSSPLLLLPGLFIGLAVGFLAPPHPLTFGVLSVLLVISIVLTPHQKVEKSGAGRKRGTWFTGLALSLPLVAVAPAYYFSIALRLELEGVDLAVMGASLLILGPIAALPLAWFARGVEPRTVQLAALLAVAALASSLLLVKGTWGAALILLGIVTSLALFASATMRRFLAAGGRLSSLAYPFLALTSSLLFLMRLPPVTYSINITYSIALFTLPAWFEYSLYAPQVLLATAAGILALVVVVSRGGRPETVERGFYQ